MSLRVVTVFGGTGFLGRRVVRHLRERDFSVRIASRHPERGEELFGRDDPHLRSIETDIHDEDAVIAALAGAWGAVNAVSLYVERARETFHSVHVEAAGRIAALAHRAGLARLVQVSGIGADAQSKSLYIRKRGEGERAVRAAFAEATLIRPAVMFSADDAFLTTILALLRRLPVYPMFGRGSTRLQPVHADDVAEAIARTLQRVDLPTHFRVRRSPGVFLRGTSQTIAREASLKPILVPVPFAIWHVLARVAEMLPTAPVTRNQVELMEVDTVASADLPGFAELGILPARSSRRCKRSCRAAENVELVASEHEWRRRGGARRRPLPAQRRSPTSADTIRAALGVRRRRQRRRVERLCFQAFINSGGRIRL